MTNSMFFLIRTIADLFLTILLLRFIFQYLRVDFYNPISQFVYKATAPLTMPIQKVFKFLPIEIICFTILLLFQALYILLMQQLITSAGLITFEFDPIGIAWLAIKRLTSEAVWLFTLSIFFHALLSWFGAAYHSPIGRLLSEINEPLLRPIRKFLPSSVGLDFSPLIALIILNALRVGLTMPNYLM